MEDADQRAKAPGERHSREKRTSRATGQPSANATTSFAQKANTSLPNVSASSKSPTPGLPSTHPEPGMESIKLFGTHHFLRYLDAVARDTAVLIWQLRVDKCKHYGTYRSRMDWNPTGSCRLCTMVEARQTTPARWSRTTDYTSIRYLRRQGVRYVKDMTRGQRQRTQHGHSMHQRWAN